MRPKKGKLSMANWKEIAGYEGLYLISDNGDVISLPKTVTTPYRTTRRKSKRIKTHLRGRNGLMYVAVTLSKNGESRSYSVHRLVAEAFIPNPDNFPEVNHKDKNTTNNCVNNLEWCTRQYNIDYSKSKQVAQYKDGKLISVYKSIKEAGKITGIKRTGINNALTGWAQTAGGYTWAYCN
jgi:hypothetical protein